MPNSSAIRIHRTKRFVIVPGLSLLLVAVILKSGQAQDSQDRDEVEATSLLGTPLKRYSIPPETKTKLEGNLAQAIAELEQDPQNPDKIIWVGRRLAYLWRYREAIAMFSQGIELAPDNPRLYRHRGHRFITIREFQKAVADFERAASLIEGTQDEIEQDGAPNDAGIPTSTLHTNIWYHLGLSYYLLGRYDEAFEAYEKCLAAAKNNDMKVATLDWMYMTLRRLERDEDARKIIADIKADLEIIENFSYHRRILMYNGLVKPAELLPADQENRSDLDLATQGYGVANWMLAEGREERAYELMQEVVSGSYWSAFGYIAAEADLARRSETDD